MALENMAQSCTTSHGFLAPCQHLEKTKDTIPRKCLDRLEGWTEGQTEGQKDRQKDGHKDGMKDGWTDPILLDPSGYCWGSKNFIYYKLIHNVSMNIK